MFTAVFGIAGALTFGSADFLGGLASKRLSSLLVTAIAAASGLVALLIALPFVGGEWSAHAVLWGGLSGVAGALAISLLYACLAVGPMSILSPLTAVVSAIVPMTAGLVGGDRFAPIGYWAFALALVAVVLVGFVPERGAVRPTPRSILMAIASGAMIGVFMILIDLTPNESGLVPLVMNRAVNGALMFSALGVLALFAARRSSMRAPSASPLSTGTESDAGPARPQGRVRTAVPPVATRLGWQFAIACGVIDALGNFLILLGLRMGDLSVVSVLTAMYPAGTILLAAVVLKERIAPVQWAGLVLALSAAGMLAIA